MPGPTNRRDVTDFIAAVVASGKNNLVTSPNTYTAALNPDNTTVAITKNGQQHFPKVFWSGNAPYDKVVIWSADGTTSIATVSQFLTNLV